MCPNSTSCWKLELRMRKIKSNKRTPAKARFLSCLFKADILGKLTYYRKEAADGTSNILNSHINHSVSMTKLNEIWARRQVIQNYQSSTALKTHPSVQFSCSVVSNSLRPHGWQHARLPCPSPTLRVHSDSYPLS